MGGPLRATGSNCRPKGAEAVDVMVERCAGLDVHRDNVVATTRVSGPGRRQFEQQTQTFKTTLLGLSELAGWLAEAGVTLVGMEATVCTGRRCSRPLRTGLSAGF
jgi:hypothetical protein